MELPLRSVGAAVPRGADSDMLVKTGRVVLPLPEKLTQTLHPTLGSWGYS